MKKVFLLITFISSVLFSFAIDIPPGGTNMIDDAITNYTKVGSQGTITVVNADHEKFNKAIKISVTSQPDNYWNFQIVFKTNMALEKDDVCFVSFWARTINSTSEAGEGLITAIEEHVDTYSKPLSHTFTVGGEWIHLFYAYKADQTLFLDKHKAAFFVGHAIQTIEIADVQFLNYKNTKTVDDFPKMAITYTGMDPDAAWRTDAAERIEKFRKGNVNIKLVDSNNNPVSNTNVTLEMKKHKFGFGTAIDGNFYLSNATYQNTIHELFNEVVFENDLKWRPWVSKPNHNYVLQAIDKLHAQNIDVRGHCLIWPGWSFLPSFMELYKNNPTRLKSECIDHIDAAVNLTKGKLIDWDVMNEPYTNHDIQDVCGDEVMADWFKRAKEIDPDVKRYINDYSILSNGGTDVNHQNHYFETIEYIDEKGGEIDGIGMQGHFAEFVTGIPKIIEILDRFATFNKEIKITEFDMNTTDDSLKVNYTRDFFTVLFSYPHVKSILSWGFWAGRHWRPEAAMYNLDWSIRLQGEMYKSLVLDEWWTKEQTETSNVNGTSDFGSCFLGTYNVVVQVNGNTIVKAIPVHFNQENNITLNVNDQTIIVEGAEHADTPIFTSVKSFTEKNKAELKIYPNPASDYLNIDLQGFENEKCRVQIMNVSGSCVLDGQINLISEKTLPLPNLKSGLYFLMLQTDNQKIVERFVVR